MKFAPIGHKVGAEHGENFTNVGQGFLPNQPQHQGAANAHHLNILCGINKTQLFDLQSDPFETKDLAAESSHAGKVKELTSQLEKALKDYGDDCPLTVNSPEPAAWSPGSTAGSKPQDAAAGSKAKQSRKKNPKTTR